MIEAMIQTGLFETPYRRDGRGAPVLLLWPDPSGSEELFARLAERFRVIEPKPEAVGGVAEAWLRGIIDGLGLQAPAIVASASLATPLLRFAMLDPGRVGRLVLLDVESTPGAPPAPAALDALSVSGHPLLLIRLPAGGERTGPAGPEPVHSEEALRDLLEFLAAADQTAAPRSRS